VIARLDLDLGVEDWKGGKGWLMGEKAGMRIGRKVVILFKTHISNNPSPKKIKRNHELARS